MTKVKKEITVDAPVDVVYTMWHNFENFPSFMKNVEDVTMTDGTMSHWRVSGPLGTRAEWDAEVTLDEPNKAIGWRSLEGDATVMTAGRVNFHDENGRTKLDVTIEYAPPGGALGDLAAKIFSNPSARVEQDLERFQEFVRQTAGSTMEIPGGDQDATGAASRSGQPA